MFHLEALRSYIYNSELHVQTASMWEILGLQMVFDRMQRPSLLVDQVQFILDLGDVGTVYSDCFAKYTLFGRNDIRFFMYWLTTFGTALFSSPPSTIATASEEQRMKPFIFQVIPRSAVCRQILTH